MRLAANGDLLVGVVLRNGIQVAAATMCWTAHQVTLAAPVRLTASRMLHEGSTICSLFVNEIWNTCRQNVQSTRWKGQFCHSHTDYEFYRSSSGTEA